MGSETRSARRQWVEDPIGSPDRPAPFPGRLNSPGGRHHEKHSRPPSRFLPPLVSPAGAPAAFACDGMKIMPMETRAIRRSTTHRQKDSKIGTKTDQKSRQSARSVRLRPCGSLHCPDMGRPHGCNPLKKATSSRSGIGPRTARTCSAPCGLCPTPAQLAATRRPSLFFADPPALESVTESLPVSRPSGAGTLVSTFAMGPT